MNTEKPLAERTVEEITLLWPETQEVLERHGIDNCCGGLHALGEAAQARGVNLDELVEELEAARGPVATTVVDVREMVPRERHPLIFATFDALPVGGTLVLVNDHDPKPLFYQFQAERAGQADWQPAESGPERWVVRITRTS